MSSIDICGGFNVLKYQSMFEEEKLIMHAWQCCEISL